MMFFVVILIFSSFWVWFSMEIEMEMRVEAWDIYLQDRAAGGDLLHPGLRTQGRQREGMGDCGHEGTFKMGSVDG